MESIQNRDGASPPRVRITYDMLVGASTESRELPFVIGVLGDFSADSDSRSRWPDRKCFPIDKDTFNAVLDTVHPRVKLKIPSSLAGDELDVDLSFRHIDDFEPRQILRQVEPFRRFQHSQSTDDQEIVRLHLDQILHEPKFQRLESAWRGLWHLVSRTEPSSQVRIELIDVSKEELLRDLHGADESNQSYVFRKLYTERYGMPGRDPFALLIGNYTFTTIPEDMELLSKVAAVAAVCHAPFIAAAAPDLVGVESFAAVSEEGMDVFGRRNFAPFSSSLWERFRQSGDSLYVGLTIPRILLRPPYGSGTPITGEYQYKEDTGGESRMLWGNSAFALGASITNAFARYGWFGSIRGMESGLAEGLPTRVLALGFTPGWEIETSMEVVIGERAEVGLPQLGFIPLLTNRGTGQAVVFSVPSCHSPMLDGRRDLDTNRMIWRQITYILTASRFMHYLKVIGRDCVSLPSREHLEQLLNSWISQYVLTGNDPSPAIGARCPLKSAAILVTERPERPGVYLVSAQMCPHFQMEEISSNGVFHTEIVPR